MSDTPAAETQQMQEAGFLMGTIKAEIDTACPFVIEVGTENPYYLDPVDLEESYKSDGMKIWFKYRGLRRMNRCPKANPISVTEIQKRAE